MELRILRNIERGPFVEFNTTGKHWDASSIFLDEIVFGIFSHNFSNSHDNFIYYGPTAYRDLELIDLHKELTEFDSELSKVTDFASFIGTISTLPMGETFLGELETEGAADLKLYWCPIVDALKEISLTLIELVENCAKDNKVLWVLGI